MKQYPHAFAVETAVNALEFCIITRSRVNEDDVPVICCPPSLCPRHHLSAKSELIRCGLYNDVINDAIATAVSCHTFSSRYYNFPRVNAKAFEYTAQQYADALQNLFLALTTPDEKE